jgi:hypothetical protein
MSPSAPNPARGWRNSTPHREVDNRHARWVWKIALGAAVALLPSGVYLLQTMNYVQTSYAIENLRVQEAKLSEAERKLQIERAERESLPVVERRAVQDLGLEHAPASRVIVVASGELAHASTASPGRGLPAR